MTDEITLSNLNTVVFIAAVDEPIGIAELADAFDVNPARAWRALLSAHRAGYLEREPRDPSSDGRPPYVYRVGPDTALPGASDGPSLEDQNRHPRPPKPTGFHPVEDQDAIEGEDVFSTGVATVQDILPLLNAEESDDE